MQRRFAGGSFRLHACVHASERVCRVWKRQTLSRLLARRGETLARAAATRESVSSAKLRRSGGWPPLAWIPWRVVHLRVKVLARGTHARTHARTHVARARAHLVSRAEELVHACTHLRCARSRCKSPHERRGHYEQCTHARMHVRTHARVEQRPRSVGRARHIPMSCVYMEDTVVLQFRYPSKSSRPPRHD